MSPFGSRAVDVNRALRELRKFSDEDVITIAAHHMVLHGDETNYELSLRLNSAVAKIVSGFRSENLPTGAVKLIERRVRRIHRWAPLPRHLRYAWLRAATEYAYSAAGGGLFSDDERNALREAFTDHPSGVNLLTDPSWFGLFKESYPNLGGQGALEMVEQLA